jgi:two-component system response regulator MtrA
VKRVLVVEDDPAVGHMIDQILTLEGFRTTLVGDGRRALDALMTNTFDIVVLDVMLPGMDGIEIMKAIRDEPTTAMVPVVILSAKTDEATTWAGWKAGCNYYMTKPFDPDELLTILKRHEQVPAH